MQNKMKSIKQLSFIGLAITLVLNSCTMKKRTYMSGYESEWLTVKHKGLNGAYQNCSLYTLKDYTQQLGDNKVLGVEQEKTELGITGDKAIVGDDDVKMIASADNLQIFPIKVKENIFTAIKPKSDIYKPEPNLGNKVKNKSIIMKKIAKGEPKVEVLGFAGFMVVILGFILTFFSSKLFLIMCVFAIIFGAISLRKIKRNPDKYKGKRFALASLILGILGILGPVLLVLWWGGLFG